VRLALSLFTVLPVPAGRVDRRAAGVAMLWAPAVGVLLGVVEAGVAAGLRYAGAPATLVAVAVLAAGALATRALHLDGLADTLDAFGSYAGRERALEIMKRSDIGPFGVTGIVLVLAGQGAAVATLAHRTPLALLAGLAVAAGTGRLAVTVTCRHGVPAARPDGLGALVAGTVPGAAALPAAVLLATAGLLAAPGRPWLGPVAVVAGLAVAEPLARHARRRFGGITGDTLGAAVELASTAALAVLAL
jgi:adenosylcobinamide-GDP ribazoletransferase